RDLDVEALHAVVAELQTRNPAASTLATLELEQKVIGVCGDGAQLIERGVVARCDDTSVAQQMRGLGIDGALEQQALCRVRADTRAQTREQGRVERAEGLAHRRQS